MLAIKVTPKLHFLHYQKFKQLREAILRILNGGRNFTPSTLSSMGQVLWLIRQWLTPFWTAYPFLIITSELFRSTKIYRGSTWEDQAGKR